MFGRSKPMFLSFTNLCRRDCRQTVVIVSIARLVDYRGKAPTVYLCFLHQSFSLDHLCLLILLLSPMRDSITLQNGLRLNFCRPLMPVLGYPCGIWFHVARSCWFLAVPVGFISCRPPVLVLSFSCGIHSPSRPSYPVHFALVLMSATSRLF